MYVWLYMVAGLGWACARTIARVNTAKKPVFFSPVPNQADHGSFITWLINFFCAEHAVN